MSDLISIIIPVYNVEKYITRCLESASSQTYDNIEIIAVNDGSKDSSLEILESYKQKDSRLVIINQENQGLSGARNSAILAAKGKYLIFLDGDDYIKNTLVGEVYCHIKKLNADILVYGYDKITEDGTLIARPDFGTKQYSHTDAMHAILSLTISPMACNKMYKRSLFIQNEIFYPYSKLHEDIGTTYKLFLSAKTIACVSDRYYYWIVRNGSITSKTTYKHVNDIFDIFLETKNILVNLKIFTQFQESYEIGFCKMISLLLDRLNTQNDENSMVTVRYLLMRIKDEMEIFDFKQTQHYKKMKQKANATNSTLQTRKHDNINNILNDNFSKKLKDVIAPPMSKRRKILGGIKKWISR